MLWLHEMQASFQITACSGRHLFYLLNRRYGRLARCSEQLHIRLHYSAI